jgi:hypothetical protein
MPDKGERRKNVQGVNAKESETVQESTTLVSKTKQLSGNQDLKNLRQRSKTTKRRSRQKGKEIQS